MKRGLVRGKEILESDVIDDTPVPIFSGLTSFLFGMTSSFAPSEKSDVSVSPPFEAELDVAVNLRFLPPRCNSQEKPISFNNLMRRSSSLDFLPLILFLYSCRCVLVQLANFAFSLHL